MTQKSKLNNNSFINLDVLTKMYNYEIIIILKNKIFFNIEV